MSNRLNLRIVQPVTPVLTQRQADIQAMTIALNHFNTGNAFLRLHGRVIHEDFQSLIHHLENDLTDMILEAL